MTSFFKALRLPTESLSILEPWLEPRKKNSECATSCAGERKHWKCSYVDGVVYTHPSVSERLPSLAADPSETKFELNCD